MNKEAVLNLLQNIYFHQFAGIESIETIEFAIEKQLLERTEFGNFKLSVKGMLFLNGEIKWEDLN